MVQQTFVIQSINFVNSEVVVVNATDEDQTLPASWEWCSANTLYAPPAYGFITQGVELVVPPGGTIAIDVSNGATPATVIELLASSGEFALYNSTGGFQQPQNIEAYVTWGAGGGGRENVASMQGVWVFNERVEMEPGHTGIIAAGRSDRATGYRSVPRGCL
jgi:hypothetical protein